MKKAKARVLAVMNQKGGVCKTTTVINLGAALNRAGKRVLLIDGDPQHDLSRFLGVEMEAGKSLFSTIKNHGNIAELIQKTETGLDVVPGEQKIMELDGEPEENVKFDLSGVSGAYDYIIIDSSPYMTAANLAGMEAADGVIVTTTPDYGSAENIEEIAASAADMERKIYGIVVTRFAPRMVLNKTMLETLGKLAKRLGTKIFKTKIRESVAIRESQLVKKDIFSYSSRSGAAADYKALMAEVLKEVK